MTRLLIIGPPGSGKGTQAQRLSNRLGIVALSTGDIFRRHVRERTLLGKQAQQCLDSGDLVPDVVTNDMVGQRLGLADAEDGFLLDGYPRTLAQVSALDRMLAANQTQLDAVVELAIDDEQVIRRLLARTDGRSDDNEEVIRHRLDLYHRQTKAVVAEYETRGLLSEVDGVGPVDEVTERVLAALAMSISASTP